MKAVLPSVCIAQVEDRITVPHRFAVIIFIYQTDSPCKPGSVEGNHLSLQDIAVLLHVESLRRCATNAAITGNLLSTGMNRIGVASDRVYSRRMLPYEWVRSYHTFPPSPRTRKTVPFGCLFLLHFPGCHHRRTLSVILSPEARTFLTVRPFGLRPRDCPGESVEFYLSYSFSWNAVIILSIAFMGLFSTRVMMK